MRLESRAEKVHVSPSYRYRVLERSGDDRDDDDDDDDDVGSGRGEWLQVQPSTAERRDSVFLRPGDIIRLGCKTPILTVGTPLASRTKQQPSVTTDVQVGSSQAECNAPLPPPPKVIAMKTSDHPGKEADVARNGNCKSNNSSNSNNIKEVAESMSHADILVDRSTTFTESLLRSTSTPKASIAQSDRIEDTPALDGGRYYDVAAIGTLATTTMNGTVEGGEKDGDDDDEEEDDVDEGVNGARGGEGNDGREMTPVFYTPKPSMSTTTSPEVTAKGIADGVQSGKLKKPSKSPALSATRSKTYSRNGRKRDAVEAAVGKRLAGTNRKMSDVEAGEPKLQNEVDVVDDVEEEKKVEVKLNQLPVIAESPDITAHSSALEARHSEEQKDANEAATANDDKQKKTLRNTASQAAERKLLTPASKRKSFDDEATPKTSRKRIKATENHEQSNKENELPAKQNQVSPSSPGNKKTPAAYSPSVPREARSNVTKTTSPLSKQYRAYNGPGLNVAFSNSSVISKPSLMRFLQSKKCSVVDKVSDKGADILW